MIRTQDIKNKAVVTYRTKEGTAQAVCSHVPSPCAVVVLLPDGSQMDVPVTHVVAFENAKGSEVATDKTETPDGSDSES